MKRLKKELLNRLPKHKQLNINKCGIEVIEKHANNMQQLTSLDLSQNKIGLIEENAFSALKNLQKLDLGDKNLTKFARKLCGVGKSVEVKIENNDLIVDF